MKLIALCFGACMCACVISSRSGAESSASFGTESKCTTARGTFTVCVPVDLVDRWSYIRTHLPACTVEPDCEAHCTTTQTPCLISNLDAGAP